MPYFLKDAVDRKILKPEPMILMSVNKGGDMTFLYHRNHKVPDYSVME